MHSFVDLIVCTPGINTTQAAMLISALEAQIPLGSKVWECLQKRNITKDILLKKWKKRSYYLAGKGYTGSLDLKNAKENFKSALDLIESDPEYVKEANELKKLINETTKKIMKENKIEKKMWSKAFSGQEEETKPSSPKKASNSTPKEDEDIDLSKFGLPNLAPKTGSPAPSSSAVAKKASTSSLFFGGAALFATLGMILGFSYFRFKKH
jgi:hypothetical protein